MSQSSTESSTKSADQSTARSAGQSAGSVANARPAPTVYGGGGRPQPANLADILERVLDKGIIIAGDIRVELLEIELLTIRIRLLVASVDKAREMGIDWWEHDPLLSSAENRLVEENKRLQERVEALESGRD